jgi:hypothetical protein
MKSNYFQTPPCQILGCIDNLFWKKQSKEAVATVVGAGCDSTKYLTLWVTHHNCSQEGWDLENVYRLQGIEQDYTEESVPSSQDQ